jgi:fluoride ion exporter CrcB/FEX
MALMRADQHLLALLNVALHVVLGLGAVWLGRTVTSLVVR